MQLSQSTASRSASLSVCPWSGYDGKKVISVPDGNLQGTTRPTNFIPEIHVLTEASVAGAYGCTAEDEAATARLKVSQRTHLSWSIPCSSKGRGDPGRRQTTDCLDLPPIPSPAAAVCQVLPYEIMGVVSYVARESASAEDDGHLVLHVKV